jgi:hypothetical protein
MGLGLGKFFKNTFGKVKDYLPAAIGVGVGALTGGTTGALIGGLMGYNAAEGQIAQKKAMDAQIASAEKIAKMQNANVAVAGETAPITTAESAEINEMNAATQKARRFSMSKTNRASGSRFGRTTLG